MAPRKPKVARYFAFWALPFGSPRAAAPRPKRGTPRAQSSTILCVLGPVFWVPAGPEKNGVQIAIPVWCFRGWTAGSGRVALAEFVQFSNKRTRKRVQLLISKESNARSIFIRNLRTEFHPQCFDQSLNPYIVLTSGKPITTLSALL